MTRNCRMERRTFLKGTGVAMALPMLDAMAARASGADTPSAPVRMAFVCFPNGAIMPKWKPEGDDTNWTLSPTLSPLQPHKDRLTIFTGLTQHHGRANGDGAGDHARSAASFLTGAQPFKTAGADIKVGVSIDQAAAQLIGHLTKFPSLELGIDPGRNSGNCDSGYSCAYSNNISWKTASTPMAKEINPKLAFERLFGTQTSPAELAARNRRRKSILDLVAADATQLRGRLGTTDQRKLDEYLTSVRELEQRVSRETSRLANMPDLDVSVGIPSDFDQHVRLMYDIIALTFQTDSTRVCTFMLANEGSNRSFPSIGVTGGHHSLSHHQNDPEKMEQISKIDQHHVSLFEYFLSKLASIEEGERSLLDNCLVLYGSGLADGNAHTHHDLPIVLAGSGGGQIATGRVRRYPKDTPLNNLYLAMSRIAGAAVDSLGDSTGPLSDLT
ncbi:MAG: DUF1552 domain-containing protein [Planctomycetes bacterium]|nr:DUF1552 domain-containing protein [Planctomycetota bacterium]